MIRKFVVISSVLALSLFFQQGNLFAAGGGGGKDKTPKSRDSINFNNGKLAVETKDYTSAIQFLLKAADETPKNADVFNLLGFSHRKLGKYEQSLNYYNRALSINPKHRGANEYIGELFLQTDDLASAEKHLKILDSACLFGCEEYDDLKEAIASYKIKKQIN